jgi:hypothetical protein
MPKDMNKSPGSNHKEGYETASNTDDGKSDRDADITRMNNAFGK